MKWIKPDTGDVRVGSYFEEAANPICWKPL
jgi:hypothetical protein